MQSLASIVRQTYANLEILVADDASTDNTAQIVQSCTDPRLKYHRNSRNLGQFANVNSTIQRAHGEFICVYHSDDVYDPTIVEKEVAFLEGHPEAGAVFTLNRRIDAENRFLGQTTLLAEVPPNTCLGLQEVMRVLVRNKNRLLCAPTFMGRAFMFKRIGLFNETDYDTSSDLEMWLRILTEFKVAILNEHLISYRKGKSQVSARYNLLRTCEDHLFQILESYLEKPGVRESIDASSWTEYAFHRCDDDTFRAVNYLIRGEADEARRLLRCPYPWRTLLVKNWRRRKVRVLLLRALLRTGLALGARRPLAKLLIRTEYGGQL
jgi:glycosyltransferase involved in cell wall biosynthesis